MQEHIAIYIELITSYYRKAYDKMWSKTILWTSGFMSQK